MADEPATDQERRRRELRRLSTPLSAHRAEPDHLELERVAAW